MAPCDGVGAPVSVIGTEACISILVSWSPWLCKLGGSQTAIHRCEFRPCPRVDSETRQICQTTVIYPTRRNHGRPSR